MCGIFGAINRGGKGPNLDRLRKIALATERRGRHAFGLAWQDSAGRLHSWKNAGSASQNLDAIDQLKDARIVIGHCRYTTHGHQRENINNHPHPSGSGFIVHNGMIHNYLDIAEQHGLERKSDCDSEVFGLLVAKKAGPLHTRFARAAEECEGDLAIMGLWQDRLAIVKRGNPLHYGIHGGKRDRGDIYGMMQSGDIYFGSLPDGLPGEVGPVQDGYAIGVGFDPNKMLFQKVCPKPMEFPVLFKGA